MDFLIIVLFVWGTCMFVFGVIGLYREGQLTCRVLLSVAAFCFGVPSILLTIWVGFCLLTQAFPHPLFSL